MNLAVANKLKVGDRVSLRTSTGSVEGTITSIGELQNDPLQGRGEERAIQRRRPEQAHAGPERIHHQ